LIGELDRLLDRLGDPPVNGVQFGFGQQLLLQKGGAEAPDIVARAVAFFSYKSG
jgi:hypothetical protein